jgi:hypothetical protein
VYLEQLLLLAQIVYQYRCTEYCTPMCTVCTLGLTYFPDNWLAKRETMRTTLETLPRKAFTYKGMVKIFINVYNTCSISSTTTKGNRSSAVSSTRYLVPVPGSGWGKILTFYIFFPFSNLYLQLNR